MAWGMRVGTKVFTRVGSAFVAQGRASKSKALSKAWHLMLKRIDDYAISQGMNRSGFLVEAARRVMR